jgi:hypothetical protein
VRERHIQEAALGRRISGFCRITLALIRLVNGLTALLAPQVLIGRLSDGRRTEQPLAVYAFRMFGIRTVLIALDLLRSPGPRRTQAVRSAPLIHASDLATAVVLNASGKLSERAGRTTVFISGVNTILALSMLLLDNPDQEDVS